MQSYILRRIEEAGWATRSLWRGREQWGICRKKKVRELLLLGKANVIEDRGWASALGDTHHKIPRQKKNPCDPNCEESSEMSHIKICRSLLLVFSTITKSLKAATESAISSCCVQSPQRDKEREATKNWEEIQSAHNKSRRTFSVCTWHGPPRTRNIHSRNIQSFHSCREYSIVPFMQGIFNRSIHAGHIHSFHSFTEYSIVPFIHGIFIRSIHSRNFIRSIHSQNIHSLHSFTEYSFVPFIHAIFIRSIDSIHPVSCPHFCPLHSEEISPLRLHQLGGCMWLDGHWFFVGSYPCATHKCLVFFEIFLFLFSQRCLSLEFNLLIFSSLKSDRTHLPAPSIKWSPGFDGRCLPQGLSIH